MRQTTDGYPQLEAYFLHVGKIRRCCCPNLAGFKCNPRYEWILLTFWKVPELFHEGLGIFEVQPFEACLQATWGTHPDTMSIKRFNTKATVRQWFVSFNLHPKSIYIPAWKPDLATFQTAAHCFWKMLKSFSPCFQLPWAVWNCHKHAFGVEVCFRSPVSVGK